MKDIIRRKEPMTIWLPGKKVMQPNLLRADKIEYLHNRGKHELFGQIFNHHLMFYLQGVLVFKMWLPNSVKDNEYMSINEALKKMDVRVIDLEIEKEKIKQDKKR